MQFGIENVVDFEKDVLGYEIADGFESGIEIEGSKKRLEGVCENVRVFSAAGKRFPAGKENQFSESETRGSLREILSPNERGADIRQFPFRLVRIFSVKEFGSD